MPGGRQPDRATCRPRGRPHPRPRHHRHSRRPVLAAGANARVRHATEYIDLGLGLGGRCPGGGDLATAFVSRHHAATAAAQSAACLQHCATATATAAATPAPATFFSPIVPIRKGQPMKWHVALFSLLVLAAQSTRPAFEAASVKPNKSGTGPPVVGWTPGGRLTAPNVTLHELMRTAHEADEMLIAGEPAWATIDRFEIAATADSAASPDQVRAMLRTLLADRFRLSVHTESRELSVFALVIGRDTVGAQLRRSGSQCAPPVAPAGWPPPPPPPPPIAGGPRPLTPILGGRCATMLLPGYISAREMTMPMLAARLAQIVRRPVIDRTGLTGMFDLDLAYATEYPAAGPGPPNGLPPPSLDAPSIFTAVREQLGLRLESTRSPLDVLVVDHAEKPIEN
jgi:uncharacterized protein (TIGR03435 family)